MFGRLFGGSKRFQAFGRDVSHDDIYAFYERLGLSQDIARKNQLNFEMALAQNRLPASEIGFRIMSAAWAAFSDGEIALPFSKTQEDGQLTSILGAQLPTGGSFYGALQAERRKVEQSPAELLPAFEILQLYWGTMLATLLASDLESLDRLGPYTHIRRGALDFAPVMSNRQKGELLRMSESEPISPLGLVIEIEPGIRGAFTVQRQFDGRLATPWRAQPFNCWTIHRNDFHAQFLSVYLDKYGEYLFDYWSENQGGLSPSYMTSGLPMYIEAGRSSGNKKILSQLVRQDSGFASLMGSPATELNKIVGSHRDRGLPYDLADLVLWTSLSVLQANEQDIAETLGCVYQILRPDGGLLIGVPTSRQADEAQNALKLVETQASAIFGTSKVKGYLAGKSDNASYIPMSYIFVRK